MQMYQKTEKADGHVCQRCIDGSDAWPIYYIGNSNFVELDAEQWSPDAQGGCAIARSTPARMRRELEPEATGKGRGLLGCHSATSPFGCEDP